MNTLHELLQSEYGLNTTPIDRPNAITVGNTVLQILSYNPNRLGLFIQNNGATTIYISTRKDVSVGNGIRILPGGGAISFTWKEDFAKVASQFYAIGSAPLGSITISEVVIYAPSHKG